MGSEGASFRDDVVSVESACARDDIVGAESASARDGVVGGDLKRIFLLLFLSLALFACDASDTWCIGNSVDSYENTDSIKTTTNTSLKVNGTSSKYICADGDTACMSENYGKWVKANYSVREGDEFTFSVSKNITIAQGFNEDDNDGLGEKWVIQANRGNPTEITGTNFSVNQQVTVTTEDCTTTTSSYGTTEPNKWTWKSGWKYSTVDCIGGSIGWEEELTGDENEAGGSECLAKMCDTCVQGAWNSTDVCWATCSWTCKHVEKYASSSESEYSYKNYNVCPSNSAPGEPTAYICDTNRGEDPKYRDTNPKYLPEGSSGWCDGSTETCNRTISNSYPSSSCSDSYRNVTGIDDAPFNRAGNIDTCWNTGGYQLYAIETGAQCPLYCDSDDADTTEPCPTGCTHLKGSYETYDETGGNINSPPGGKSFAAVGGTLYLQIINPNSTDELSDTSDELEQIDSNDQQIDLLEQENSGYYAQLNNQHNIVNDYDDDAQSLESRALSLISGLSAEDQGTIDQLNAIAKQFNSLATTTTDTEGNETTTDTPDLLESFETFDSQINLTGQYTNEEGAEPENTEWKSTIRTMKDQSSDIITAASSLNTNVNPSGETTPDDLQKYKDDVSATLTALNGDIDTALDIQEDIEDNNNEIASYEASTDELNQEILETNVYDNDDLIGGYVAYVKAGPIIGMNGQFLHAIVCDDLDPNVNDEKDCYRLFDNGYSSMTYTYELEIPIGVNGDIWFKIEDPDYDYTNNGQSYDVLLGKITYVSGFNTILTGIIEDIKNTVVSASRRIFVGLTCSDGGDASNVCSNYILIITALLYLYVIIFGMMYFFGAVKYTHVDFVMRIVKIATVTILIQPSSFEFFNDYLFNGFWGFSDTLISSATGAPLTNPFEFLDLAFNILILDETTYFKIIGVMFQGLTGLVAFALLLYGVFTFISAFFSAFLVYMISFVGLGLCFATGPIFIAFLLFEKTSYLFENWFKTMVRLTVQPTILMVGLIIINGMLISILEQIFNYQVCFKCTIPFIFALPGFDQVGTTTLFCVYWFSEWGADNVGSGLTKQLVSLPLAINFCLITSAMKIYADKLANDITGHIVGSSSMFQGSSNTRSMGLNPLQGLDDNTKGIAKGLGLAKDDKSYKALRNKVMAGAAFAGIAVTNPMVAIGGATLYNDIKNKKKEKNKNNDEKDPNNVKPNANPNPNADNSQENQNNGVDNNAPSSNQSNNAEPGNKSSAPINNEDGSEIKELMGAQNQIEGPIGMKEITGPQSHENGVEEKEIEGPIGMKEITWPQSHENGVEKKEIEGSPERAGIQDSSSVKSVDLAESITNNAPEKPKDVAPKKSSSIEEID